MKPTLPYEYAFQMKSTLPPTSYLTYPLPIHLPLADLALAYFPYLSLPCPSLVPLLSLPCPSLPCPSLRPSPSVGEYAQKMKSTFVEKAVGLDIPPIKYPTLYYTLPYPPYHTLPYPTIPTTPYRTAHTDEQRTDEQSKPHTLTNRIHTGELNTH